LVQHAAVSSLSESRDVEMRWWVSDVGAISSNFLQLALQMGDVARLAPTRLVELTCKVAAKMQTAKTQGNRSSCSEECNKTRMRGWCLHHADSVGDELSLKEGIRFVSA